MKKIKKRIRVYVVHEHEKNDGSSILLVTRNEKRARSMEQEDPAEVDWVSVDELDLEA